MYPQGAPCAAGFRRPFLFYPPQAPILRRSPTPRNNSGKRESCPAQGRKPLLYVIIYQNRPCYKSSAPQGGFFANAHFSLIHANFFILPLEKRQKSERKIFRKLLCSFYKFRIFRGKPGKFRQCAPSFSLYGPAIIPLALVKRK